MGGGGGNNQVKNEVFIGNTKKGKARTGLFDLRIISVNKLEH